MSKSVAESSLSKVNCPGCGAVFGCGSNPNCEDRARPCWCRDIELSEAALVKLQTLYQGCLCKDCLLSFGNQNAESSEPKPVPQTAGK